MKVFLEKITNRINDFQKPVLTYILLSLLAVSLFILLTACGDRKATPDATLTTPASSPANQAPDQTQAPQSNPESAFAAARITAPTNQSIPVTPGNEKLLNPGTNQLDLENYQPVIRFTPEIVPIGGVVEVSGSGYPANTRLNIRVSTADLRTEETYATVLTGESGSFITSIKLEGSSKNRLLTPGKIEIAVTTQDNLVGASAPRPCNPLPTFLPTKPV